jgi:two-component system, cell cycle response regulator DivK
MSTILIAEDNAVNRELLREILEANEYLTVEARDGREALAKIEESRPDVMLLDINMPGLDGFSVLKRVREHPHLSNLPVLAVTAYAMKEDRDRVLGAGFNGYISKPIQAAVLLKLLGSVVGRSNKR